MYNQDVEIAEIKEAEAQKQLLLEYKPEVAKASETIEKGVDEKIKVLPKINLNTAKRGEIKEYLSQILKPILDKPLRNTQGLQAYLNNASIDKMISDKAITKSVENGFSKQEHLEAVADIERLFSISKEAIAHSHRENNPGVIIHRLNAPFKESNALITTKESLDKNKNRIYSVELELTPRFNTSTRPTDIEANKGGFNSLNGQGGQNLPTIAKTDTAIIPQNPTKAQSEYFNPFMNEYEKIKEIKKLHTQDDNLIRVMKVEGRNDYIEPLSNMGVSKEYLQKQTAQSLKEQITQAILGNQTQLKALQQGYNTYHLSPFQKEVLESVLDIVNNPTKYKEYKLQGLQKQLNNLNNNEAYHIEKSREYDKSRYAKDKQELEKEISALKGTESNTQTNKDSVMLSRKAKHLTFMQVKMFRLCLNMTRD